MLINIQGWVLLMKEQCRHETFYIEKSTIEAIRKENIQDCGFGRGLIVCYDCGLTLKQIFDKNK